MKSFGHRPALAWGGDELTYADVVERVDGWTRTLEEQGVKAGECVAIDGDYSPNTTSLMIALIARGCVIVPLSSSGAHKADFLSIAGVEAIFTFDKEDRWQLARLSGERHPLYAKLEDHPGLVLFSSGSTGKAKGILHDFTRLLSKFEAARKPHRCVVFLFLDHIGGLNTLFSILSSGGMGVCPPARSADDVCAAIARHRADLLPTSPTFLNLLLMSGAHKRHDLSSLRVVTYGTEPMPEATLVEFNRVFPEVEVKQTYGLSELGVMRSKSKDSRSVWVKVGGEGYETKIVDSTLWIRSDYAMIGYLNAESPFDDEGWFRTGDVVKVDGDYVQILGRQSEIINVGGEKVYPSEVESVLLQVDNVADASVYGKPNAVTGQVVAARLKLAQPEELASLRKRVLEHCRAHLARFKVPVLIEVDGGEQYGERFKKLRPKNAE
jgi:acyl-CoA synthetase (AMP-forming)/AMP-acid ligase II